MSKRIKASLAALAIAVALVASVVAIPMSSSVEEAPETYAFFLGNLVEGS